MINVFLVHGTFGKPFENWFPWLENELSKFKITCNIPTFPTPKYQNYDKWEKLADYYCDLEMINAETVLIGHSCGAVFLVHYLLKHRIKVKGLITISGYNNFISGFEQMDKLNESFYLPEIKKNSDYFPKKIFALYGDDDPNIPQNILKQFAHDIGANAVCVQKAGHFNASAGYTECPIILDLLCKEFM